jgi:hypothetical protein
MQSAKRDEEEPDDDQIPPGDDAHRATARAEAGQ